MAYLTMFAFRILQWSLKVTPEVQHIHARKNIPIIKNMWFKDCNQILLMRYLDNMDFVGESMEETRAL